MSTHIITLSDETRAILIALAREQVSGVELDEDELLEVAIDCLATSYDASLPSPDGAEAEPATAAELQDAIKASLNPDISLPVDVRSPQSRLDI